MLRKPAIEGSNTVTEKLVAEVQPTEHPAFNEFVATIEALRSPDGCPWDKEQTHKSISGNMVEEAYEAVDAIEADDVSAVLAGAGSAPTSALKSGAEHARTGEKAAFDGYRPVAGSKAITPARSSPTSTTTAVENDFLGNAVKGRPDLGAVESDVVSVTMASSKYETGTETDSGTGDKTKVIHVTFTDKNPVTVKELLSNVSADKGVDKAVYRVADAKSGKSADARSAESEPNMLDRLLSLLPGSDRNAKDDETKLADSEPVRDGDILRFSAEGTDETDEYTIRQRITWDWVADYEQGVADFDWKAQRRTSAGGEWTTISAYDGSWPNTVYDQYYGVGVNGTLAELSGDRKQTHGLLIDKPGDGLPTAMAWKAPKAGTVKVSIREDEPYLRQDGSNGKALTLRLMHDDKVVCFADLTVSKQRSEEFANCVADQGRDRGRGGRLDPRHRDVRVRHEQAVRAHLPGHRLHGRLHAGAPNPFRWTSPR
mgnify:CR=1 FL=1